MAEGLKHRTWSGDRKRDRLGQICFCERGDEGGSGMKMPGRAGMKSAAGSSGFPVAGSRRTHFLRKLVASLLLLGALTQPVRAADVWHTAPLRAIYPMADGSFALLFANDSPACSSASPKYHWVTIGQNGMTEDGAKKIYAAAMLAFATSTTFSIVYSDSTSSCFVNRLYLGS